jgi:hypothetical protein
VKAIHQEGGVGEKESTSAERAPATAAEPPKRRVTVFGAGVAGLTAAQELAERGFKVEVITKCDDPSDPAFKAGGSSQTRYARAPLRLSPDRWSDAPVSFQEPSSEDEGHGFEPVTIDVGPQPSSAGSQGGPRDLPNASVGQIEAALRLYSRSPARSSEDIYAFRVESTVNAAFVAEGARRDGLGSAAFAAACGRLAEEAERLATLVEKHLRGLAQVAGAGPGDELVVLRPRAKIMDETGGEGGSPILLRLFIEPLFPLYIEFQADSNALTAAGTERLWMVAAALRFLRAKGQPPRWYSWRLTAPPLQSPLRAKRLFEVHAWLEVFHIGIERDELQLHPNKDSGVYDPPLPESRASERSGDRPHPHWVVLAVDPVFLPGESRPVVIAPSHRNLLDTLKRIPLVEGDEKSPTRSASVFDNLVPLSSGGAPGWQGGRSSPQGPVVDLRAPDAIFSMLRGDPAAFSQLLLRLLRYGTTSPERREGLQDLSFWDYVQGIDDRRMLPRYRYPDQFKKDLSFACRIVAGVAADVGDARTCANAFLQMLRRWVRPAPERDRVFNGPISEAWFGPWQRYLEKERGVELTAGELVSIHREGGGLVATWKPQSSESTMRIEDGYFVVATDASAAHKTTRDLGAGIPAQLGAWTGTIKVGSPREPSTKRAGRADVNAWSRPVPGRQQIAGGIQYFFVLKDKVLLEEASFGLRDFAWSVTATTSHKFWRRPPQANIDGYNAVISVDILAWEARAEDGPLMDSAAGESTASALAEEVWRRISPHLTVRLPEGEPALTPRWFYTDVALARAGAPERRPRSYVVPLEGDWKNRPGDLPRSSPAKDEAPPGGDTADDGLWRPVHGGSPIHWGRLVFAGSYLKTFTRTSTLEAANESARHAVNAILEHARAHGAHEPEVERTRVMFEEVWAIGEDGTEEIAQAQPLKGAVIDRQRCDVMNPEDHELPELAKLKRYDAWCVKHDLPHPWDLLGIEAIPALMSWSPRVPPASRAEPPLADALRALVEKTPPQGLEEALLRFMKSVREVLEQRSHGDAASARGSSR